MKSSQPMGRPVPNEPVSEAPGLTRGGWFALAAGALLLAWGLNEHEQPGAAVAMGPFRPTTLPAPPMQTNAAMGYRAAVQRFNALRDAGGDPSLRLQAAREVDAGLDERLASGELRAPEGLLLKIATTQVMHADPAVQQETVARWRAQVAARAATQHDPREALFRKQEAALMAQYRALPAAQRDPGRLNEAVRALRVAIFAGPMAAPQNP